jgi:hypothetical protein
MTWSLVNAWALQIRSGSRQATVRPKKGFPGRSRWGIVEAGRGEEGRMIYCGRGDDKKTSWFAGL